MLLFLAQSNTKEFTKCHKGGTWKKWHTDDTDWIDFYGFSSTKTLSREVDFAVPIKKYTATNRQNRRKFNMFADDINFFSLFFSIY